MDLSCHFWWCKFELLLILILLLIHHVGVMSYGSQHATILTRSLPSLHLNYITFHSIALQLLSYITAEYGERDMKIPGQNEWIESLHRIGVMDHSRFLPVVILSTLGMASGLSLGPEMPLVLSAGMVGSFIALKTKQSVLSSRVINLTAASAAIGGFFGFPMAGALFVLELPHRMGLQYFEALSPAVIASIISVISNRMVTGKTVEGYFDYPFLAETLPSSIFYTAVVYGVVGTVVGVLYSDGCLFCKNWVHDWFHVHHDDDHHDDHHHGEQHGDDEHETSALMGGGTAKEMLDIAIAHKKKPGCLASTWRGITNFIGIEHEPTRAGVAGVLVGVVVGLICMFLPHQLFWGEGQLQVRYVPLCGRFCSLLQNVYYRFAWCDSHAFFSLIGTSFAF